MRTVPIQDSSLTFFSYLVNNFLNLLCHEFVLSTTHLLVEYFFAIWISAFDFSSSSFSPLSFFLYGMCSTYPRLINSSSSCLELYPLSRHRCCLLLLLISPVLDLCTDGLPFLLITVSSTTSGYQFNVMSAGR